MDGNASRHPRPVTKFEFGYIALIVVRDGVNSVPVDWQQELLVGGVDQGVSSGGRAGSGRGPGVGVAVSRSGIS